MDVLESISADIPPRTRHTSPRPDIPGWGVDLPQTNRPGVPRRKEPRLRRGSHLSHEPQQQVKGRVHKSIERPGLPLTWGTSCPPKALSGLIRDFAYQLGEGKIHRWMILILADRVDMVEALVGDILRGHIPNLPKELGLWGDFKHDKKVFLKRSLLLLSVLGAIGGSGYLLTRKGRKFFSTRMSSGLR